MSVYSQCIFSNISIREAHFPAALKAIQKKLGSGKGIFSSLNLELCSTLQEALSKLDMEFEKSANGITAIAYAGGSDDKSILLWPVIAPYVVDCGEIIMEHDGERETVQFNDGEFQIICDDYEEDEDYDEDEGEDEDDRDDVIESLIQRLADFEVNPEELNNIIKEKGIENLVDNYGVTALLATISLLEDCDEEFEDKSKNTLNSLIEILLEAGSDVNRADKDGLAPLFCALAGNRDDLAERLVLLGAKLPSSTDYDLFEVIADDCNFKILQFLHQHFKISDSDAQRCLIMVCANGNLDPDAQKIVIEFLINQLGVDINSPTEKTIDYFGCIRKNGTALMAAALSGSYDIAKMLIDLGADADLKDANGNLALHYCSGQTWNSGDGEVCWRPRGKNLETVKLFANAKNIVEKNIKEQSPYLLAFKYNEKAIQYFNQLLNDAGLTPPILQFKELTAAIEGKFGKGGTYNVNFKNGELQGEQKFFHPNGNIFVHIEYKNGIADGTYNAWHKTGEVLLTGQFKEGKPFGEIKYYSQSGQAVKELSYDENGKRHGLQIVSNGPNEIAVKANYSQGKPHGHVFFKNINKNKVLIDEEYQNGEPAKQPKKEKKEKKKDALDSLFGAIFGGLGGMKDSLYLTSMEELLCLSENLFFHQPKKVKALVEKSQLDSIH